MIIEVAYCERCGTDSSWLVARQAFRGRPGLTWVVLSAAPIACRDASASKPLKRLSGLRSRSGRKKDNGPYRFSYLSRSRDLDGGGLGFLHRGSVLSGTVAPLGIAPESSPLSQLQLAGNHGAQPEKPIMELTRFDLQNQAIQKRIAQALERIAAVLEEIISVKGGDENEDSKNSQK